MKKKRVLTALGVLGIFLCTSAYAAPASNTLKNILSVYDEEVNIRTRYLAYAHRADEEGYRGVGSLFRAVARGNEINSAKLLKSIKKLGGDPKVMIDRFPVDTTRQNLDTAARVEQVEWQKMYSQFVKEAKDENILEPVQALRYTKTAQNRHEIFFHRALESLDAWKKKRTFFVCRFCGYTVMKLTDRQCPSCREVNSFDPVS